MKVNLSGDMSTGVRVFRPNQSSSSSSKAIRKPGVRRNAYVKSPHCRCRNMYPPYSQEQFDRMSADELVYLIENSPNPELMGAALKKFFQKAAGKAKAVVQKVKTKYKAMPTWAKVATGTLVPGAAVGIAAMAAGKAVRKKQADKKAAAAKRAKAAKVAKTISKPVASMSQSAINKTLQQMQQAKGGGTPLKVSSVAVQKPVASMSQSAINKTLQQMQQAKGGGTPLKVSSVAVPSAIKDKIQAGQGVSVAAPAEAAEPEKKKSALGMLLPLAALASLFLLGN